MKKLDWLAMSESHSLKSEGMHHDVGHTTRFYVDGSAEQSPHPIYVRCCARPEW